MKFRQVQRAVLGISFTELTAKIAEERGITKVTDGILVGAVSDRSTAMEAGIQSGDIIIRMDKSKIVSFADYGKILNTWQPGETKEIYLMRKSQDGYKSAKVQIVVGNW